MKYHPHLRFLIISLLFSILSAPIRFGYAEEMGIVAVVNDEPITQDELDKALAPVLIQMQVENSPEQLAQKVPEAREKILQQLIEERLMLQEARNPKPVEVSKGKIGTPPPVTVSDEEVNQMIEQISAKFPNAEAFNDALSQHGMTLDDLRAQYRDHMTVRKLIDRDIRSRVNISPTEVTSYYQAHVKDFVTPVASQVAVIFIPQKNSLDAAQSRDLTQNLKHQLDQGADFYELAKRYSEGPNAKMGGRIGFMEKGKSLKEIDDVLFTVPAGAISSVIRTNAGFQIFKVESVRPAHQASLDEAQSDIRDRLFQEKSEARYKEWIDKLKASSYIIIK